MSQPFVFEKPLGMRDLLPEVVERKNSLQQEIQQVLKQWGYQQIETPALEFYDTVGKVNATMEGRLFKLLDRSGRSLILRSDMTAPIARVVASLLKEEPFPIRLSYQGNVFRAQENEAGRNAEFAELGIELVGEDAPDADAEVIALAIASLKAAKINRFTLAIGHIGFINGLFEEILDNREKEDSLKRFLHQNNFVGYRQFVEQAPLSELQKNSLLCLLNLRGGVEQLQEAEKLAKDEKTKAALFELQQLWSVLAKHRVTEHLIFDFTLIRDLDYYTGVLFEGYADQLGFPVCNGGRYDHLLGQFGRPAPATGFALKVDRLLEVSQLASQNKVTRLLLTYTEDERTEAFAQANQLRAEGHLVTLHRLRQKDEAVDLLAKRYDSCISLEGGNL